jgi:hypothetical protein
MSKITAEHLQRAACVYIRQSTPDQLVHNLESQRRQYALADRAKQLGWTTAEIIDDDLGRSGGGIARPGFERLLAASVPVVVRCSRSRLRVSLATVATGTHSSSFVDWSAPSSSTRTASTIHGCPTTVCFSACTYAPPRHRSSACPRRNRPATACSRATSRPTAAPRPCGGSERRACSADFPRR